MPPSLNHLPDELLLYVLSFIPGQNTRCPVLNCLSRCSRRLHAIATPLLYASINVRHEMPLLLRSLIRHPHLRRYPQLLTLYIPEPARLWTFDDEANFVVDDNADFTYDAKTYFTDDVDAKLLRTTIEEILRDDAWHQPPPEGWCSGELHAQGFGANAAPRWFAAANTPNNWNAQCALLLALMPGLTHLEIQTTASTLRFGRSFIDSFEPYCELPDCMSLLMLAAANTQLRALAVAADPARAPQHAADGVLPRLRYVSFTGTPSTIELLELLPLALPPLVEELRLGNYRFGNDSWNCADCATQMKLNVRTLTILKSELFLSQFRHLLCCFPKLEKLVGCPGSMDDQFDDSPMPTMLETLESAAGTLKELNISEDVWRYESNPTYYMPSGPLCDFPVLEKLSISAERQIEYWRTKQNVPPNPVLPEQMLLGHFPASLKELTITGKTHAPVLEIVPALSYLLDTHEVPALQLITVGMAERARHSESVMDLRRRCEARGIGLALPLVWRMKNYQEYQEWFFD